MIGSIPSLRLPRVHLSKTNKCIILDPQSTFVIKCKLKYCLQKCVQSGKAYLRLPVYSVGLAVVQCTISRYFSQTAARDCAVDWLCQLTTGLQVYPSDKVHIECNVVGEDVQCMMTSMISLHQLAAHGKVLIEWSSVAAVSDKMSPRARLIAAVINRLA